MPPDIVPVDYDPFSDAANAFPSFRAPASDLPQPLFNDFQVNQGFKPFNKLFGTGGETRHVLWPEQMVRRGLDVVHGASQGENQLESAIGVPGAQPAGSQDATYEPNMLGRALGMTEPWRAPSSESGIAKVQDLSGLMAGGPLIERSGTATLGSGAVRRGAGEVSKEAGNAPPFYSAVEAAVRDASQPSMSPEQWRGYLSNRPGVKAEELDWVGLPEGKKVTKQEMLDHVQEHGVQVKEVEKRGIADMDEEIASDVAYRELMRDDPPGPNESHESWLRRNTDRLDDRKWELLESEGQGGPKFGPDSAPNLSLPGGENYREKLFTLPEKKAEIDYQVLAERQEKLEAKIIKQFKQDNNIANGAPITVDQNMALQTLLKTHPDIVKLNQDVAAAGQALKGTSYQSSHWDEPNVLAHVRMNDRVIPDGTLIEHGPRKGETAPDVGLKTLHLEELQSDWHQAGRKQGYKGAGEGITPEIAAISKRVDGSGRQTDPNYWSGSALTDAVNAGRITEGEAGQVMRWQQDNAPGGRVPDVPFKTTWPDLVLKRMIRDAAEGGYDAISWTPGEAQAARYDLSKQLDNLSVFRHSGDKYSVVGDLQNGNRQHNFGVDIPEAKLADYVGKELAEKIIKNKENQQDFDKPALKVGGEGMKGFYDKILVDKANALAKKFGGKVEYKELPDPQQTILDAMPEHQRRHADLDKIGAIGKMKVPVLRLTPQMKDTALRKGFPLFSAGAPFPLEPVDHDPFKE